jgi:hypothetical protein
MSARRVLSPGDVVSIRTDIGSSYRGKKATVVECAQRKRGARAKSNERRFDYLLLVRGRRLWFADDEIAAAAVVSRTPGGEE